MSSVHAMRAIAWLRVRLLVNRLRAARGKHATLLTAVLLAFWAVLSLALALLLGALARNGVVEEDPEVLRLAFTLAFWLAALFGVVLPLVLSGGSQGMDVSRLLAFPVSRHGLHAVSLGSCAVSPQHLFYYPLLATTFVAGVVLSGASTLLGGAVTVAYAGTLVAWAHSIGLLIHGALRTRRGKEALGLVAMALLIALSMAPAILGGVSERRGGNEEEAIVAVGAAFWAVARVFPPSLAAESLMALHVGQVSSALAGLAGLGAWLAAALGLGHVAFVRYHLSVPRGAGAARARSAHEADASWLAALPFRRPRFIPAEAVAVAEKEWRYLMRSMLGKFVLGMTPLLVLLLVFLPRVMVHEPVFGLDWRDVLLNGLLVYVALLSNTFFHNALAWDGDGIKSYFMLPVPLRSVVLGKNLALWGYNVLTFTLCLGTWTLAVGLPSFRALVNAPLSYAAAVLAFTAVGNLVSVTYPAARGIGSVINQLPGPSIVISLLTVVATAAVLGAGLSLPMLLGLAWLQPAVLLALLIGFGALHSWSLGVAAGMLARRKDRIITALSGRT